MKYLAPAGFCYQTLKTMECYTGSTISTWKTWENRAPKDWQVASPLVMQGFSKFLGLFQVIMANPVTGYKNHTFVGGGFQICFIFLPKNGGNDPIWLAHMFQLLVCLVQNLELEVKSSQSFKCCSYYKVIAFCIRMFSVILSAGFPAIMWAFESVRVEYQEIPI